MHEIDMVAAIVGANGRDCSCCHKLQPDTDEWAAYQMDIDGDGEQRQVLVVLCPECEKTVDALTAEGRDITIQEFGLLGLSGDETSIPS
jgi:hypothetical protein